MELTLGQRESSGVVILDLSGKINLGEECNAFKEELRRLLSKGQKKILLNMADVTRVDSSGIGAMVEAVVLTAKEGGRLKVVNLPRVVRSTLTVNRLLQAFDVFEGEDEALRSFAEAAGAR